MLNLLLTGGTYKLPLTKLNLSTQPPGFSHGEYQQYGNKHSLEEYKGKVIFLNFWATWCPPCIEEMKYIENIYNKYGFNKEEVIILGVAAPNSGREGTEDYIKDFLNKEGYKFPVLMDLFGENTYKYGINAFPTTFIIDKDGYIANYIQGAISQEYMESLIKENVNK